MRLRRELPEEVPALLGGERLLAWERLYGPTGGYVVASKAALHWTGQPAGNHQIDLGAAPESGSPQRNRVPWEDVITASWSDGFLDLVCRAATTGSRAVRLRLADPGRLPEVVRERVMFTVLATQQVELRPTAQPTRKVVLTARRPGVGPGLRWDVVFDPSGGPLTPAQLQAIDGAIDRWADQLGIGPSTGPVARIARVDPP